MCKSTKNNIFLLSRWGVLRGCLDCARLSPVRNMWKNKTQYKKKYYFIKKKKDCHCHGSSWSLCYCLSNRCGFQGRLTV